MCRIRSEVYLQPVSCDFDVWKDFLGLRKVDRLVLRALRIDMREKQLSGVGRGRQLGYVPDRAMPGALGQVAGIIQKIRFMNKEVYIADSLEVGCVSCRRRI